MVHALYAHLWSIADRGLERFVHDLEEAGLNGVSYAATYHAVRQLMPAGSGRRIFYVERSYAYFTPRGRYGRLRPEPSPLLDGGELPARLARTLAARGMRFKAWVIGCHNTALARAHPDLALQNAYGEPLPHHLCPSRAEVQEYLAALLADIAGQLGPAALELESFDYAGGFAHGSHHEMCGVPLDGLHDDLLGLCFCDGCRTAAAAAGVDAAALGAAVRSELDAYLATPAWRLAARSPETVHEEAVAFAARHPELEAYRSVRRAVVAALGRRLREAVRAVAPTLLTPIGFGPAEADAGLAAWSDGLVTQSTAQAVRAARRALGPSAEVVCGVYPLAPRPLSPERIAETLRACAAAGCTGFNYYNHGLMQASTLADIRQAIGARTGG